MIWYCSEQRTLSNQQTNECHDILAGVYIFTAARAENRFIINVIYLSLSEIHVTQHCFYVILLFA